jgi:hypothetical protein
MPRKRTRYKRHNVRAEYEAWRSVFDCGIDFFEDLGDVGVPTDRYGRPDPEYAEKAWRCHGAAYLETHGRTRSRGELIWALTQFGEPQCLQSA